MKKLFVTLLFIFAAYEAFSQVPYFAGTVGNDKLYGYTSLKARPGINAQETYTCFQYGIGNHVAVGTDLYTGVGSAYWVFWCALALRLVRGLVLEAK